MNEINFSKTADGLKQIGAIAGLPKDDLVFTNIDGAKDILSRGMDWAVQSRSVWLPEYDEVADWLTDNGGRGLLMFGDCGRGKSLLGKYVLPVIFNFYLKKIMPVFTANGLNQDLDSILKYKIVSIDDIGTEIIHNQYGSKRIAFQELVDAAESEGKLIVISTNLSLDVITERYGIRTVDRLKAITRQVLFTGESLRA